MSACKKGRAHGARPFRIEASSRLAHRAATHQVDDRQQDDCADQRNQEAVDGQTVVDRTAAEDQAANEGAEAEDNGPGLFGDEAGAQAAE